MDNWINIKDRLPENRVGKLLLTNTGHIFNGYYDKEDNEFVSLFLNGIFGFKVTHWQPLPPPPKGENNEK